MPFSKPSKPLQLLLSISSIFALQLFLCLPIEAATPDVSPHFDVASVRQNKGDGQNVTEIYHDSDTLKLRYVDTPLIFCLQKAFDVENYQISGPSWIRSTKYDISAAGHFDPADREAWRMMLRNLLSERFKLVVHQEQKNFKTYELQIAKGGTKIHQTSQAPQGGVSGRSGQLVFRAVPMSRLAEILSRELGRPVIDQTNLPGTYSFELHYSENRDSGVPGSQNETGSTNLNSAPSLITALKEQLGLEIRAHKAPITVFVIDRIEAPSPN